MLRQTGDLSDHSLAFNLDFQAKDNKVLFRFEDLEMRDNKGKPLAWAYAQITDAATVETVKPYLEPMKSDMLKAINGGDSW